MKRKLIILLMIVCVFTASSNHIYADEGTDEFSSSEINIDNSENIEPIEELPVPDEIKQDFLDEIEKIDDVQNIENCEIKQAEFEWTAPEFADMKFSNNPDKIVMLGTVEVFNYVGSANEKTYIVIESDFVLSNEVENVSFQISKEKDNWEPLTNGGTIIELTVDDSGNYSQDLYFRIDAAPSSKGLYTGNISFKVVRENIEQDEEIELQVEENINEDTTIENLKKVEEGNDLEKEQFGQEIKELEGSENINPENVEELINEEEYVIDNYSETEQEEINENISQEKEDNTLEESCAKEETLPQLPLVDQEIILIEETEEIIEEEGEAPCEDKSEEQQENVLDVSQDNNC